MKILIDLYLTGLDVLVNSAGILVPGPTETLPVEDFDRCMNINTRAAFVLTQAALPHLLKAKGNIVHVSSVTGNFRYINFFNQMWKKIHWLLK